MQDTDKVFAGSIPAIYDRFLGPMIFEPYAVELTQHLGDMTTGAVLEIAAGTGIVTRALARALPQRVAIVATDLNQPMLDYAAEHTDTGRVSWRQADALALPFEDGAFDAVVCQFGVMFFPDKGTAYREAMRVLKPNGRFVFNAWDRIEENEFADVVTQALAAIFPGDPPRFMARTPHGYHDVTRIRDDLRGVGFTQIEIETIARRSPASSHRDPAIGYCQGTPLRNEIEARAKDRLGEATEAAAGALAERFGSGPFDGKIQAHVIKATK